MDYEIIKAVGLGKDAPQIGETWKRCGKCDYGMRSDHERITGEPHINLSRDGDYPFFTVPQDAVREVA